MADTIIFYHSEHHGNTKKLVDAIAAAHEVEVVSIPTNVEIDFSAYKNIGFASGIYMQKFHKTMFDFAEENKEKMIGKRAFLIYTHGAVSCNAADSFNELLNSNGINVVARYYCRGFDTFGPFKLIGGIAKGHPAEDEILGAVRFFERTLGLSAAKQANG